MMGSVAYALCAIASAVCFGLLLRAYLRNKIPLLLWSSLCFFFMTMQNGILFIDLVIVPQIDLSIWRSVSGFVGSIILLCALIWENK